jgi:DNA-binding transcriptional regulator YdaS (Cro superfamily)
MDAMQRIKGTRGLCARIARELGITASAVSQWPRVPEERAVQVAAITGIPVAELRPDVPWRRLVVKHKGGADE